MKDIQVSDGKSPWDAVLAFRTAFINYTKNL